MNFYDHAILHAGKDGIASLLGPDPNYDHYVAKAVLDAAAPMIAAKALREAAERIVGATMERLSHYDGDHADTARLAIGSCVDHLTRSADHIEGAA